MTLVLKSLKPELVTMLEADGWDVGKLAVTTVKKLVGYRGIGRVGAAKIIVEAAGTLNERRLDEADQLAEEHYYRKSSRAKVLTDWEEDGLPIENVALTSARALSALKGIDEALALRLISKAQDIFNKRGLYQSSMVLPGGRARQTNSAFDVRELSGEIQPRPMSNRIRRNFEAAQREYRAAND